MPDQTAPDHASQDPRRPDWPLADLKDAAEAHWDDAARLRLLLRDLEGRADPGARDLSARVAARLRDVAPRVIRRDPAAFTRVKAAPLPKEPTPEMAALLRQLQFERASGEQARQEAATLRQRLSESRAPSPDETLKRDLEAARAEARAAREEAKKLAERLAFVRTPAGRARPEDTPPRSDPTRPEPSRARPAPDPIYAELGLSPDMPDELIPVLERALLRHHHPDRAAPEAREAATARFQSVTIAFQRIRKLRGL